MTDEERIARLVIAARMDGRRETDGLALAKALVARSLNGGEIMMWRELDMARAIIAKAEAAS